MKCKHCYIGRFYPTQLPYITPLDNQLMIVPNAAAYQCDTCKRVVFNEAFLDRLHYFLDSLAEDEMNLEMTDWYTLSDQRGNWQSSGRNS